jgi:hypothetical protein
MTLWYGRNASVKIGATISVGTAQSLYATVTGTDYSAECKDLTINPGEAAVDVLNVFSTQLVEESRPTLVTADFTMIYSDIDLFKLSMGTIGTFTGYERFQGTDATGLKTKKAIAFQLAATAIGTCNILMNNAYITNQGEVSIAADGTGEQTFSAACLNTDFYVEDSY